jgi:hypothetical protein
VSNKPFIYSMNIGYGYRNTEFDSIGGVKSYGSWKVLRLRAHQRACVSAAKASAPPARRT